MNTELIAQQKEEWFLEQVTTEGVPPGHHYRFDAEHGYQFGSIKFQNGPVKEVGVNGTTNEMVLAMLIHRMYILNAAFPCRQNSLAITKMEEALMWLNNRTAEREQRGVEGTNQA